jgi:crossover junction endodeoxyribonuclease RusA
MTQRGKYVRPEALKYLDYKEKVGWLAKAAGVMMLEGEIAVKCTFYLDKKKRQIPDLDNLIKAVLDGLNGIAWLDDSQVVRIIAERRMSVPERVEVSVEKLDLEEKVG